MLTGPSFPLFGAYFPAWMLCLFLSFIAVLVLRAIFIGTGVDELLALRLTTYTALTVALTSLLALAVYG